jgi:two-component system, OmpR family, response regulator
VGSTSQSPLRRVGGSAVHVLIVEDEPILADLLTAVLRLHGWQTTTVATGLQAVEAAACAPPDAVLLDLGLPDLDGLEVLTRLRAHAPDLAVVMLTARDGSEERAAATLAGADDYITKPFAVDDVLERLSIAMRRHGRCADEPSAGVAIGDLYINPLTREVRRGDTQISLSATEFELLLQLATNVGVTLSKAQIIDHVWHYDFGARSHIVELSIAALRRKIDARRTPMIHTTSDGYSLA